MFLEHKTIATEKKIEIDPKKQKYFLTTVYPKKIIMRRFLVIVYFTWFTFTFTISIIFTWTIGAKDFLRLLLRATIKIKIKWAKGLFFLSLTLEEFN